MTFSWYCYVCLYGSDFYLIWIRNSAWADGGPRSPSAHAWRVRSSPHRRERKFSSAHVCRDTFKHLPQPLRSHIRSFGTLWKLFKIPPFPPKYVIVRGVGGVPEFCFRLESSYLFYLGAHTNFQNPTTIFWENEQWAGEKKEERKRIPLTPMGVLAPGSAHARPSAQPPIDMSGNFPAHVSAESPSKFSKKPKKT